MMRQKTCPPPTPTPPHPHMGRGLFTIYIYKNLEDQIKINEALLAIYGIATPLYV